MPAMLILLTSMSTLALLSKAMIAIPSLSLMLSSKTTSSGKRTLRLPGFCRAKTLALRDMTLAYVALCWADCADCGSSNVFPLGCHSGCMIILSPSSQFVFEGLRRRSAVPRATFAALVGGLGLVLSARWGLWRGLRASAARRGCLDLVPVVHGGSKPLIDGGRPKTSRPPFCPSGHGRSCSCTFYLTSLSSSCLQPFLFTLNLLHQDPSRQAAARARKS